MLTKYNLVHEISKNIPTNVKMGEKKIIVGCSGGPDSTFLLRVLIETIKNPTENIFICHINFKLRGKDSDSDEKFIRETAEALNLKLYSFEQDLSACNSGIQEKAREYRIDRFIELSIKENTNYIFLGHNLDDQVETILLNIVRGSNLKGLSGIKKKNTIQKKGKKIIIYRPLINIRKKEIKNLCSENNINYRIDKSNNSNYYSRNLIRNKILPELEKINPNVTESILSLSNIGNKDIEKIKLTNNEFEGMKIDAAKAVIFERFKNIVTSDENYFFGKKHHIMIENILQGKSKSENLPGDIILTEKDGYFILKKKQEQKKSVNNHISIEVPGAIKISEEFKIESKIINKPQNLNIYNENKILLGEKFINKKMFIRIKKDGDRIKQFKNSEILTRVKKVLSNYKKKNKNEALILCSEETILWIIGVRQSVDSYVQKNDKKVIEFSILKNPIQS